MNVLYGIDKITLTIKFWWADISTRTADGRILPDKMVGLGGIAHSSVELLISYTGKSVVESLSVAGPVVRWCLCPLPGSRFSVPQY